MTYNFKKQLVSKPIQRDRTYGGTNQRLYIAVHMTGNTRKGANAPAHANLQSNRNSRQASWHEQIDDKVVIQSFPHTAQCWHSGKGRDRGNLNAIALELCVNSDGDYDKMIENAVARIRDLMTMYNIPLSNVIQHHDLSGKNCPRELRQGKHGITWNSFLSMIAGQSVTVPKPKPSKPAPAPKPQPSKDNDMPNLRFGNRKKVQNFTKDRWTTVQVTDNNGVSTAFGSVFDTNVIVHFQAPTGTQVRGRFYKMNYKTGKRGYTYDGESKVDSPVTTGNTMMFSTNFKGELGPDERLRFEVYTWNDNVRATGAAYRTHEW